jgi:hypothetical protein
MVKTISSIINLAEQFFSHALFREIQAKAKRLARFKAELSDDFENSRDAADQKISASGREQAVVGRQNFHGGHSIESAGDLSNSNISPEFDGSETLTIIVGLCPDMCPGIPLNCST